MTELTKFLKQIKKANLTPQQFRTLKGQAINGDLLGATIGLKKITGGKNSETNRKNGANSNRQTCSIHK